MPHHQTQTKSTPWRTFSIFISSTFSDMQAERDYLKTIVFPRVEEELHQRRIKLQIVDLRWGVDTTSIAQEEERESTVLKVCLDEIKRCRPFFIGLLGDRYGWMPPYERIEQALVGEDIHFDAKNKSVTELEINYGVLACDEQLMHSIFYFREPLPYGSFSLEKAAMFSDKHNRNLSDKEKETRVNSLSNLKSAIQKHFKEKNLEEKVKTYEADWDSESGKVTNLERWGELVYNDILNECKIHAEDSWDKVPKDWKEQELALIEGFIEQHTDIFCGRKELLEGIKQHLLSPEKENWGMILTGESGSGKSAVFAMTKKAMEQEACFVLAHSAGLSPRARNVADLLQVWNNRLSIELGVKDESEDLLGTQKDHLQKMVGQLSGKKGSEQQKQLPIEKLQDHFRELLFLMAEKRQVVLLVDALDSFEPSKMARFMTWLPVVMPGKIRMFCTAVTGKEKDAIQYQNNLFVKSINHFTLDEAKEMLQVMCRKQRKTLPVKVEEIILKKNKEDGSLACSNPLWLSIAVNILLSMDQDDFEKMRQLEGRGDTQIEAYMIHLAERFSPEPGNLFIKLIANAGKVFGEELTKTVFNYLACSRSGLREKDLEQLLHLEGQQWNPLQFTRLRRWFRDQLVLQGEDNQWSFTHGLLKQVLADNMSEVKFKKHHTILANYLLSLSNDKLKSTETIYYLMQAGQVKDASDYYGSLLSKEEENGATKVLSEIALKDAGGLDIINTLPELASNDDKTFNNVFQKYIIFLDDELSLQIENDSRIKFLKSLEYILQGKYGTHLVNVGIGFGELNMYGKLGDAYFNNGDTENALEYYKRNNDLCTELIDKNKKNKTLKYYLALSFHHIGTLYEAIGQWDMAISNYDRGGELIKEFLDEGLTDIVLDFFAFSLGEETYTVGFNEKSIKIQMAKFYEKSGRVYLNIGNTEQAYYYINQQLQLFKELHNSYPADTFIIKNLALANENLGNFYFKKADFKAGITYYNEQNKLLGELYKKSPDDISVKINLAMSYSHLGDYYYESVDLDQARFYYEQFNVFSKQVTDSNPQKNYYNGLVLSFLKLGDLRKAEGDLNSAQDFFIKYNEQIEVLYKSNPQNPELKYGYAVSLERLGEICQYSGDSEKALQYFGDYSVLCHELCKTSPKNLLFIEGLGISYVKLGDVQTELELRSEAHKSYANSLEVIEKLINENPDNYRLEYLLSVSLGKLGMIQHTMNQLNDAYKSITASLEIIQKLKTINPKDRKWLIDLLDSYDSLGSINKELGRNEEALENYEELLRLALEHYESNPKDNSNINSLALSYNKLSEIHQLMDHMEEACIYFEKEIELKKELCATYPQNISLNSSLSIAYRKLGLLYKSMDQMEEALNCFEKDIEFCKELLKSDPDEKSYKDGLAISYQNSGIINTSLGNQEKAIKYLKEDIKLSKELLQSNPRNEILKDSLANSIGRLGTILYSMGILEQALIYFEEAELLFSELHKDYPRKESYRANLAITYGKSGVIHESMNNIQEAHKCFENYNRIAKELYETNPLNGSYKNHLAISFDNLGSIHESMGHLEEALIHIESSHNLYKELFESNHGNETLKNQLASSYSKLGNIHESMGQSKAALANFTDFNRLIKELFESYPDNVTLMEGLGISYIKLAMVNNALGNHAVGKEYFALWKNIITRLTQNFPQVKKYQEWKEIKYDNNNEQ